MNICTTTSTISVPGKGIDFACIRVKTCLLPSLSARRYKEFASVSIIPNIYVHKDQIPDNENLRHNNEELKTQLADSKLILCTCITVNIKDEVYLVILM